MLLLHDKRIPASYLESIIRQVPGLELLAFGGIPGCGYGSISCHPDIFFCSLDPRTVVHAPGIDEGLLRQIKDRGVELLAGDSDPGTSYPGTAAYNAFVQDGILFHNLDHTDPVLLKEATARGIRAVHVPQGYSRCSVMSAGGRSIITSDMSLSSACLDQGMRVLRIGSGSVSLPGELYGFIGGCSGLLPDGRVVVAGDILSHPDGSDMEDLFLCQGEAPVRVSGLGLFDGGGLFFFE